MEHQHNHSLVFLSILISIFSSYIALDLANRITFAKSYLRKWWLVGGSTAMGMGIWSMHFVGMLAFSIPGLKISYDVPLMILSILVAIAASGIALNIVTGKHKPSTFAYVLGGITMAIAIAGMHYIGIASMRMNAEIHWNWLWVTISILIALVASLAALLLAFKLRDDVSTRGLVMKFGSSIIMGFAIAGMHYTAMMAMEVSASGTHLHAHGDRIVATDGLAILVIISTMIILGMALFVSLVDRALTKRTNMNLALEAAIKARDEFLSIASHELKTPLTSIKLQTQIILKTITRSSSALGPEEELTLKMLKQTNQSVERIVRLVDDMLDISRLSTGKLSLQKDDFNLADVVKDTVERVAPLLTEAKCVLTLNVTTVIGKWDKFRLEQIVTNLMTNAARYGAGKPVEVEVSATEDSAFIIVRDHGRGIPPEDLEKIFLRFERSASAADIRGLGLGLFISQQIAEMHGGKISVESEVGKGSKFIVRLPLKEEQHV